MTGLEVGAVNAFVIDLLPSTYLSQIGMQSDYSVPVKLVGDGSMDCFYFILLNFLLLSLEL